MRVTLPCPSCGASVPQTAEWCPRCLQPVQSAQTPAAVDQAATGANADEAQPHRGAANPDATTAELPKTAGEQSGPAWAGGTQEWAADQGVRGRRQPVADASSKREDTTASSPAEDELQHAAGTGGTGSDSTPQSASASDADSASDEDRDDQDVDLDQWAERLVAAEGSTSGSRAQRLSAPSIKYGIIFGGALLVIFILLLLTFLLSLFVD